VKFPFPVQIVGRHRQRIPISEGQAFQMALKNLLRRASRPRAYPIRYKAAFAAARSFCGIEFGNSRPMYPLRLEVVDESIALLARAACPVLASFLA
jgi:hypothetical protein